MRCWTTSRWFVMPWAGSTASRSLTPGLGSLRRVPLSTRALMIITVILLVAVALAAIVVWWVTRQPPLTPIEVPTVSVA
jgi:hypothetical protein